MSGSRRDAEREAVARALWDDYQRGWESSVPWKHAGQEARAGFLRDADTAIAARGEEHEQAPGESPTPDDDVIVRWECPECGWSIPDESSAGEGQPCEAWMLDDEIGEHGPTQKVRYRRIRSPQGEDD